MEGQYKIMVVLSFKTGFGTLPFPVRAWYWFQYHLLIALVVTVSVLVLVGKFGYRAAHLINPGPGIRLHIHSAECIVRLLNQVGARIIIIAILNLWETPGIKLQLGKCKQTSSTIT